MVVSLEEVGYYHAIKREVVIVVDDDMKEYPRGKFQLCSLLQNLLKIQLLAKTLGLNPLHSFSSCRRKKIA